jgi:hypothetical protein
MASMMSVWGPARAIVGFLSVVGATEIVDAFWHFRFVPEADMGHGN